MNNFILKQWLILLGVFTLAIGVQQPIGTATASVSTLQSSTASTSTEVHLQEDRSLGNEVVAYANAEATYTLAQVAANSTQGSCWSIVNGVVYNITSYIKNHPGGVNAISKICGRDGTSTFSNQHGGSSSIAVILSTYKIGILYKPAPTSCNAGFFVSPTQGTCTAAPKGYFVTSASSAAGVTTATPCPLGKYSSVTGSTECLPAPPGYFVDTPASTGTKPCQKGYFSSTSGSTQCQVAAKGFYVAAEASSIQSACAAGYTTASTGSTTASSCYKPIVQNIPGFTSPKALKYGASTDLAITTNTKALASYKVSGPCMAKVVSIVKKIKGKNLTTKMLEITASAKAGTCKITLSSPAKDKYLAMSKPVKIMVSKTGK